MVRWDDAELRRRLRPLRRFRPRQLARRVRSPKALYLLSPGTGPLSAHYGVERGVPVDRYYVDRFIEDHAADLRGRVLEIGADHYVRRYGGTAVELVDVLDIDPGNAAATITGDLRDLRGVVEDDAYDCVVLVMVLQFVDDVVAAVAEAVRILAPGGTLLLTVPGISPIDAEAPEGYDSWRFTRNAVAFLLRPHIAPGDCEITTWGNARAGLGIWVGMAQEDLRRRQLDRRDERYPCVVTARAVKR